MTKADLVEQVASEAEMTKKDAEQLVEIVFDSIVDALNKGEKISGVPPTFCGPKSISLVLNRSSPLCLPGLQKCSENPGPERFFL